MGGGELRWVSLAGFMELGEAGIDRAGVVYRIGVLGPKVTKRENYCKTMKTLKSSTEYNI